MLTRVRVRRCVWAVPYLSNLYNKNLCLGFFQKSYQFSLCVHVNGSEPTSGTAMLITNYYVVNISFLGGIYTLSSTCTWYSCQVLFHYGQVRGVRKHRTKHIYYTIEVCGLKKSDKIGVSSQKNICDVTSHPPMMLIWLFHYWFLIITDDTLNCNGGTK